MSDVEKKEYEWTNDTEHRTLRFCLPISGEGAKTLETEVESATMPKLHIVINCETIEDFPPPWVRALLTLSKTVKTIGKSVRLAGASNKLRNQIRTAGIDKALPISISLNAALIELGIASARTLDVNFINPFLQAAMNTLKIQAQVEAQAKQPYKRNARETLLGDISGIIGLVSEAFTGTVVISFPEKTFLNIMSKMLGEKFESITQEIQDGAAEFTNIIFGQAKVVLNERGFGIKTALPSVVTGKHHSVMNLSLGPRLAIPFETDAGEFFVEICLSE